MGGQRTWIFVQILGVLSLVCVQSENSCRTPRNLPGECMVVHKCPPLMAILENRPIMSREADFLRRSQCGHEGMRPKVCCPLDIDTPLLPTRSECGIQNGIPDRITGGERADIIEFPWMALLEYERENGKRNFFCGGVLISKRYILTAAHCVKGKDSPSTWTLVNVRLGEYNTSAEEDCVTRPSNKTLCSLPPQNIAVEERIVHEDYDPFDINQYHDIALLRLGKEANITRFVAPVCLPRSTEEQSSTLRRKLIVAGWGKTENRAVSDIKLKLFVPLKNNSECSNIYKTTLVSIHDGQLCAGGEKGKDSCKGDSGGPLMSYQADENGDINWFSVGVVSFGPTDCGLENWPGVYTKVASNMLWIVSKLKP